MDSLPNGRTLTARIRHSWWKRIRAIFLLDDDVDEAQLVRHWQSSVYRIIVISSIVLCLLVATQALLNAWELGVIAVVAVIIGYYIALFGALAIERRRPRLSAVLLLAMIYLCGFLILFGIGNYPLSDLGVIFLYVAPMVGWIYFGVRTALLSMLFNCLPFAFVLAPQRPLMLLHFDMLVPNSHAYLHGLLFLFFNISMPLAFFRVFAAKQGLLKRYAAANVRLREGIRELSNLRRVERELADAEAARQHLMAYDPLTNLPNADYLEDELHALRTGDVFAVQLHAVVTLRLNSVRAVNQKFGPAIGDELIREFARLLAQNAAAGIMPCRMRGVVFALLFSNGRSAEELKSRIEQFLHALPQFSPVRGHTIELHYSVGVALLRGADISVGELLHRSESALEIARKTTPARVVYFNEEIARESNRETEIEMAFSGAFARSELHMVYQPKVDEKQRVRGLEALLRWSSAELGPVSPAEFIPLAERSGRIHAITDFVITHVCIQLRAWLNKYGNAWPVAINLSGIDLQRDDLSSFLIEAARAQQIMPALLHIEITETGLIEDDEVALRNLQMLTDAGFRIAIDDFGTGYSSLKKLSDYPINTIKIDRSFVLSIGSNGRSEQIIRLILALASFLQCEAVAEGVETSEQLQFLLDNGCNSFQGYLFHRPMTEAGIDLLLAQRAGVSEKN